MKRTRLLAPAAVLLLAAAPAAARAATVATDYGCYVPSGSEYKSPVIISGTQFAPGAPFSVTGTGVLGNATVDAAGNVAATIDAPMMSQKRRSPKTVPFQATDGATTVAGSFQLINGGAIWQGKGLDPTRTRVRWSFGGFLADDTIYVHVRRDGRTLKTTRVGKARGACGTVSKRLARLPIDARRPALGTYLIYVDSRRRFSRGGVQYPYRYRVTSAAR